MCIPRCLSPPASHELRGPPRHGRKMLDSTAFLLLITEYLSCEVLLSRLWNGIPYPNMKADDSTVVGES